MIEGFTLYSEKEKRFLEQRSLENLVGMYRQELLKIIEGEHCFNLIPKGVRKRMRKDEILKKLGNRYSVTSLGIKIIREGTE